MPGGVRIANASDVTFTDCYLEGNLELQNCRNVRVRDCFLPYGNVDSQCTSFEAMSFAALPFRQGTAFKFRHAGILISIGCDALAVFGEIKATCKASKKVRRLG